MKFFDWFLTIRAWYTFQRNRWFCRRKRLTINDVKIDLIAGWRYPHKLPKHDSFHLNNHPQHHWRHKLDPFYLFGTIVTKRVTYHPDDEGPYRKEQQRIQKKHKEWFEEVQRRQRAQSSVSIGSSSRRSKRSGGSSSGHKRSNSPSVCNNHGSGV